MKKALSLILTLVLSLSVFAGMTVFAVEPVEWDHILVFSYFGYDYHKSAENITADFEYTDWSWAFDGISAYLEADGEKVTGIIEDGVNYTLVIKLKIIPGIDERYGFSSIPKEQIKLFDARSAEEYYSDGEYLIAKFALTPYEEAYDTVSFHIDGYALGTDVNDITVTADMEGFGIYESTELLCKENAYSDLETATGEIKMGVQYVLTIMYTIPEGTEVSFYADAVLYGAGDLPIVNNSGQNQIITQDGTTVYMTCFPLPKFVDPQHADWNHILVFGYMGYLYHNSAEDLTAYFRSTDWSWAFDGISADLELDGEQITGMIEAGIEYTLVIKMKIIPGFDEYYEFSSIPKEQIKLNSKDKNSPHAYEYYSDGEYLVAKFMLPQLKHKINSADFYLEGFELGARPNDVVIYSDNDMISNCTVSFNIDGFNETGVLCGGFRYTAFVGFNLPGGITAEGMASDKIKLHLQDGEVITGRYMNSGGNDYYWTAFEMPNLDDSYTTITNISFNCSGYAFGEPADNIVVTTETEGIIISSVIVKSPENKPHDNRYYEFHGNFDADTNYRIELFVTPAAGYRIYDNIARGHLRMDVGLQYILAGVTYRPSGDGYVFICSTPVLTNPNLEPKTSVNFSMLGYEVGADVDDIVVTVDDEEIEVRDFDIIYSTGGYCTGKIEEGKKYEVSICVFAPGGWDFGTHMPSRVCLDIGKFIGCGIALDRRIMSFSFELPVFGELIEDPDDPGNDQYDKIASLDLRLTGYELGNEAGAVSVTCDNENAEIRKVSFQTSDGIAYDGAIEAGRRYKVSVVIYSPGGWDLSDGKLSGIKLEGIAPSGFGIDTVHDNAWLFEYYVYALAPGDDINVISDMDGDGEITITDALSTLRIAAKLDVAVTPKSTRSAILGDVDRDGKITVADALLVLRIAAKLA